ncbi:MAG TPA: helix-turn-helix transcriptional regulator [Xanthobacteraceae bacterium]|nr:helix-turn-helix transcriptional regulator [Xanthobacteraceae bacterium]
MSKRRISPVDQHVGRLIRIYRIKAEKSQEALGDAIGVTFQQVQKYEKGVNRVGAGRLSDIARALNVPTRAFFEANENPYHLDQEWVDLLSNALSIRMLRAFTKISDPKIQNHFVALAESVAVSNRSRPARKRK